MLAIDHVDIYQEYFTQEKVEKSDNLKYLVSFSNAGLKIAGIIKIPPKEQRNLTYQDLPRTIEDENKINDLISTMGSHGKITLLLKHKGRLEKIGDEIRYLHPFKFLGFIFSHPDLKANMANIFDDYFKRTKFIDGLSETFDTYDLKNKLTQYIDDFAKEINIPANEIKQYIDKKDWNEFVKFLINY